MKPKSDNKIYEALMVERETRQKFKEAKDYYESTKFTNTSFLEYLLDRNETLSQLLKRNS